MTTEQAPSELTDELPHEYLLAKLAMVMPLLQESRDALTAISEAARKIHGVSPTLADRMDIAGTFSLEDWRENFPDRALVASQAPPAAEPVRNVGFDHLWILVQTIAQEEASIRHPHTSRAGIDGAKRRRDKAQAELRVDLHELLAAVSDYGYRCMEYGRAIARDAIDTSPERVDSAGFGVHDPAAGEATERGGE